MKPPDQARAAEVLLMLVLLLPLGLAGGRKPAITLARGDRLLLADFPRSGARNEFSRQLKQILIPKPGPRKEGPCLTPGVSSKE
jgi:hypothetical protein